MKFKTLLSAFLVGFSLTSFAQTHEQGIEYYKADQFSNAQELLNRNLNNPGTDKALSYYYLGQIAVMNKDLKQAAKYFDDGLQADPNCAYNYVGKGLIALKNGDAKTAASYFKDAESKGKKDPDVAIDIIRAYYDADPVLYAKEIDKRLANASKKNFDNSDLYILEGDMLRDQAIHNKDQALYGKAAAKYDMAIGYEPTSASAYVKYANMYSDIGNINFAITKLEELLRNNSNSALGQRELANAYYEKADANGKKEDYAKAADYYGKYVHNPNHFKNDEDRYAFLLFYDEKFQDGYDYATTLLNENPDNFTARRFQFMNAAQLQDRQDQMLPMANELWKRHQADPDHNGFAVIDYNLVADQFSKNGKVDDAIVVLNEGIEKNPKYAPTFNRTLSDIWAQAGDYGKATDARIAYVNSLQNPSVNDYYPVAVFAYYGGLQRQNGVTPGEAQTPFEINLDEAQKYFNTAIDYANKGLALDPENANLQAILNTLTTPAPADGQQPQQ